MKRKSLKGVTTEGLIRQILKRRTKKFSTRKQISKMVSKAGRPEHSYDLDKVLYESVMDGSLVYCDQGSIASSGAFNGLLVTERAYRSWRTKPMPGEVEDVVLEILYNMAPDGLTLDMMDVAVGLHYFNERSKPKVSTYRILEDLWKRGLVTSDNPFNARPYFVYQVLRLTSKGLLELHEKFGLSKTK